MIITSIFKNKRVIEITKREISYNLGKNILFDKIDYGENVLVLYQDTSNHQQIFRNFLKQMSDNNHILFYVSHKANQISFNFDVKSFFFNIINEEVIHNVKSKIEKCIDEMEKTARGLFLVCDWSKADLSNCEIFFPFLESLVKKSQGVIPSGWKRGYKSVKQKTPFTLINAFETTNVQEPFIHDLLTLHQRCFLLQNKVNTFLLPTLSHPLQTFFPKYHVLPQKDLEKLAKDNLELITLFLIGKEAKSGYQLLKEIAGVFHCIIPQGTFYPLLYKLKEKGKIFRQNSNGREIIYSLTHNTKQEVRHKEETLLRTYQHLISFFERGGEWKKKRDEKG